MEYRIEFSQNAKKELDSLQREIAVRILKKLREIITNPYRYTKRLAGSELFSMRAGDYRILMMTIDNKIFIVKIGHRKDVYE